MSLSEVNPFDQFDRFETSDFPLKSTRLAQDRLMLSAIVVFLPPIFTFALGWAGLWIVRGFRS